MKFSIIIPAHNEAAYITRCLESVKQASVPYPGGVEILCVLNRCTDDTVKIALKFLRRPVYSWSCFMEKLPGAVSGLQEKAPTYGRSSSMT